jgi:hypothetical protein
MKIIRDVDLSFSDNSTDFEEFQHDLLEFRDGDKRDGDVKYIQLVKKHIFENTHESPVWYDFKDIKMKYIEKNVNYFREQL